MGYAEFQQGLKLLNNNQYTQNLAPAQQAAIGWDMSSVDYSAPGIEGWTNRFLGLSSIVNPFAWKDTWEGVVRNNAYKNKSEGKNLNFLEQAGQNVLGYTGGILKGTFQGVALPAPVFKGVSLSLLSGLDEITDSITGSRDEDTFLDKVGKSWNLSLTDDWEFGQDGLTRTWEEGRGNIGVGDIAAAFIGDVASIFLQNASKDELRSMGAQFIHSDFDIFDPTQKQDIQSHILNVPLQQPLNFIGEWMLDLFTVIPGGPLVKGARLGYKGLGDAAQDVANLRKASRGEATAYDPTLSLLAETDDTVLITNTLKSFGVADDNISLLTGFLQRAKTNADVANVFLAAEYRDRNAIKTLFDSLLPNEKTWKLALDGLIEGGTYARTFRSNKYIEDSLLDDADFKPDFIAAIDEVIDSTKVLDDAGNIIPEFAKLADDAERLKLLTTTKATGADGAEELTMLSSPLRDSQIKTTALGREVIKWRSKLLDENSFLKTIEYNSNVPGIPTIIRVIRKMPMTSYRGSIDVNDVVLANDKGISKLQEIDSISKGELSKSGELKRLADNLLTAKDKDSRVLALDAIEKAGLKVVANKHKIFEDDQVQLFIEKLIDGQKIAGEKIEGLIKYKRKIHDPSNNTVIFSDVAKGVDNTSDVTLDTIDIVANRYYSLDLKALDNLITRDGMSGEALMNGLITGWNTAQKGMSYWMKAILTRPARFPRERLANLPGIILSGNIYDMFLSANAKTALYNSIENAPFRLRRSIDSMQIKKDLTGSYFGNTSKAVTKANSDLEILNSRLDKIREERNRIAQVEEDNWQTRRYGSAEEIQAAIQEKVRSSTKTVNTIEGDEFNRTFADRNSANAELNTTQPKTIKIRKPAAIKDSSTTQNNLDAEKLALDAEITDLEIAIQANSTKAAKIKASNAAKIKAARDSEVLQGESKRLDDTVQQRLNTISQEAKAGRQWKLNSTVQEEWINIAKNENVSLTTLIKLNQLVSKYLPNDNLLNIINTKIQSKAGTEATSATEELIESLAQKNARLAEVTETLQKAESNVRLNNLTKKDREQLEEYAEDIRNGYLAIYKKGTNGWVKLDADIDDILSGQVNIVGEELRFEVDGWAPTNTKVVKEKVIGKELNLDEALPEELITELQKLNPNFTEEAFKARAKSGRMELDDCSLSGTTFFPVLAGLGVGLMRFTDELGQSKLIRNPEMVVKEGSTKAEQYAYNAYKKEYDSFTPADAAKNNWEFNAKSNRTAADEEAFLFLQKLRNTETKTNPKEAANFLAITDEQIDRLESMRRALEERRNKLTGYVKRDRSGKKPRISEGRREYKDIEYDNFGEGTNGKYAEAVLHPGQTWQQVYGTHTLGSAVYGSKGGNRLGDFLPGDKFYFEAYAAWLQFYGRNDEVFMKLANGESKEQVIDWLKNNSVGKDYARSKNLGKSVDTPAALKGKKEDEVKYAMSYEEWIDAKSNFVENQLSDQRLKNYFLEGHPITAESISEIFKGRENRLLPITGSLFTLGENASNANVINRFFDGFNKLVVENPQQILENVPMATAYYNDQMKNLIDMNIAGRADKNLTVAEVNALQERARKDSIRHVRKWVYNVQSKSNFADAMTSVVPFITAYTFTVRMLLRGFQENPAAMLWMMSGLNKMSYDSNWVDSEGNSTSLWNASHYAMPIDPAIAKLFKDTPVGPWLSEGKDVKISTRSLNVWFGGEAIPGPGPLVTLPVSELAKGNPVFFNAVNEATKKYMFLVPGSEGLIDWMLPFGASEKPFSYDQLLPQWTNLVADSGAFVKFVNPEYRGRTYIDAYTKIMAHESAKARLLGPEAPLPTSEEVQEKVDALFGLKVLSALFGPASWSVRGEADIAREEYRKYVKLYGEDADWKFLTEHPELISGMISTNKNTYGLAADTVVVQNLKNNGSVADLFVSGGDGAKSMLGFFMNTSGDPEFNDFAYKALRTGGIGVGEENWYDKLTPSEVAQKAAAEAGWVYYNKLMDAIDADALERDVDPERDIRLSTYKKTGLAELKNKYPEWAADYGEGKPYQYAERANVVKQLLTNEGFLNNLSEPSFANALAIFTDAREGLINELNLRASKGGVRGIGSSKNQALRENYNKVIFQLKSESNRFADFYNRYFDRDNFLA